METSLPTPMTARVELLIYWRVNYDKNLLNSSKSLEFDGFFSSLDLWSLTWFEFWDVMKWLFFVFMLRGLNPDVPPFKKVFCLHLLIEWDKAVPCFTNYLLRLGIEAKSASWLGAQYCLIRVREAISRNRQRAIRTTCCHTPQTCWFGDHQKLNLRWVTKNEGGV